jgi:hypothetical protein
MSSLSELDGSSVRAAPMSPARVTPAHTVGGFCRPCHLVELRLAGFAAAERSRARLARRVDRKW